jgi:hypothetical protein
MGIEPMSEAWEARDKLPGQVARISAVFRQHLHSVQAECPLNPRQVKIVGPKNLQVA